MKKYHIHIYNVISLLEDEIEANSEEEARQIAHDGLYHPNERYSDYNESDFKKPDTEYIILVLPE